tara:strand:- start:531 stop:1028 length:498 start_codon:yes stop_codon:yes gene_type:complete
MMGIGFPELMVILIIIMIIFGAGKLPDIGSAFGRSIKNFKTSMKEADEVESSDGGEPIPQAVPASEEQAEGAENQPNAAQQAQVPTQQAQGKPKPTQKTGAKKEEEDIIDQAIDELKNQLNENKINTIRTRHDGLVQERDVFTESVKKVPFGMKRSDRGVSRDVF